MYLRPGAEAVVWVLLLPTSSPPPPPPQDLSLLQGAHCTPGLHPCLPPRKTLQCCACPSAPLFPCRPVLGVPRGPGFPTSSAPGEPIIRAPPPCPPACGPSSAGVSGSLGSASSTPASVLAPAAALPPHTAPGTSGSRPRGPRSRVGRPAAFSLVSSRGSQQCGAPVLRLPPGSLPGPHGPLGRPSAHVVFPPGPVPAPGPRQQLHPRGTPGVGRCRLGPCPGSTSGTWASGQALRIVLLSPPPLLVPCGPASALLLHPAPGLCRPRLPHGPSHCPPARPLPRPPTCHVTPCHWPRIPSSWSPAWMWWVPTAVTLRPRPKHKAAAQNSKPTSVTWSTSGRPGEAPAPALSFLQWFHVLPTARVAAP